MKNSQSSKKSSIINKLKYFLLVLICLTFASIRLIRPTVLIDGNTVWLIAIITAILIIPDLKVILPYIKRIRVGDTEIELAEQAEKLGKTVEQVNEEVGAEGNWEIPENISFEVNDVLNDAKDDPRAAFLLLATKIENVIRTRMDTVDTSYSRRFITLPKLGEEGVVKQIFPAQLISIFTEFWIVRNKIAHGQAVDFDKDTIYSWISVGTDILKLVSIEKKQ